MDRNIRESLQFPCYYADCNKNYQSLANLIRHINSFHVPQAIYQCPVCLEYITTADDFKVHSNSHRPKQKFSFSFKLSEHFQDPTFSVVPINLLKIPILPPIEPARKVENHSQKLPLTPEILSALLTIK